jgi:hypothetical protein
MIVPFPNRRGTRGTVVVMPHQDGGFEIGHESESGSSWGHFSGPYATCAEAAAAAHKLNREVLNGECVISIRAPTNGDDLPPVAA